MMSVGGLAAGMAHEINNPLGAMVQNAQNILRRISPHLPKNKAVADQCGVSLPAIMDYLERREIVNLLGGIRLSGLKASEIVENMLNFSRKSESRKAPVHLAELLERTVSLAAHDYDLKKKYDFRRIAIERDYDQALAVCCVATEIEQVILNLLRNAAQATTQNEKEAACPTIALRLFRENNMAVIEVRDNGQGISEHDMKRVFEPFYTTKDVGIGTGLGLSVSYFIVTNNHNGTMEVQSEPGKGSCFIVRLPLQDGSRSRPTAFAA
jgi:two-component system, NtrC family, sensor kinase